MDKGDILIRRDATTRHYCSISTAVGSSRLRHDETNQSPPSPRHRLTAWHLPSMARALRSRPCTRQPRLQGGRPLVNVPLALERAAIGPCL